MENKEMIKEVFDILDKMEFFGGQRAGRELWFDKPKEVQDQDIDNFVKDINFIRSYLQDSVVLSKAKYEMLTACSSYEGIMGKLKDEYIRGSKETAEKIFSELNEQISTLIIPNEEHNLYIVEKWEIVELAKQFGVNIKES